MNKKFAIGLGVSAVLLIIAYFIFSGGSSEKDLLKVIPEKAVAIVKIDFKKVSKWLEGSKEEDFKDLKKSMGITEGTAEALSRVLDAILKDPKASGIDFSLPSYLYVHKTEKSNVIGWVFGLSAQKDWERMVKDKSPVGTLVEKIRDINYAELETGSYFSWNNNVLLYTYQPSESRDYFVEQLETRKYNPVPESLIANVTKQNNEISGAINTRWLMSSLNGIKSQVAAEEMPKNMALVFNSFSENGKFRIESELINTNAEALEKFELIKPSTQNKEMLAVIPKNYDPFLAFNFGLDFQKMHQLKIDFFEDVLDLENRKESEKIEKCLTGDISFFAFDNTDIKDDDTSNNKSYGYSFNPFNFKTDDYVLIQGLAKDYADYEKTISSKFTVDGNLYTMNMLNINMTFKNGNNYISSGKKIISEIAAGEQKNTTVNNPVLNNLLGHGNFFYLNPEKLYHSIAKRNDISNTSKSKLKLLENRCKFTLSAFGKEKKSIIEILFANNSVNGFKQLLLSIESFAEFSNIIQDEYKDRRSYMDGLRSSDSYDRDAYFNYPSN